MLAYGTHIFAASLLALTLGTAAAAVTPADLPTDSWNTLLGKYVQKNGGVDYQGLDQDFSTLEAFIKAHAAVDMSSADDKVKKTTYINLYNATMIYNLLRYAHAEKIDVGSAKFLALEINAIKVPGGNIWNGDYKVKLAGMDVNLDDIEHNLIRGKGDGKLGAIKVSTLDPRIHAAVNCAAMSCPRVREMAYRADTLDAMLDDNMREFMSTEAQFSKADSDTLNANQIVYWYYDDFETYGKTHGRGGAGGYLAPFLTPETKDKDWKTKHLLDNFNDRGKISLKLSSAFSFQYDWHVNDKRNKK